MSDEELMERTEFAVWWGHQPDTGTRFECAWRAWQERAARPAATQAVSPPMTDERIYEIAEACGMYQSYYENEPMRHSINFARAIERELRAGKGTDHE